MKSLGIFFM